MLMEHGNLIVISIISLGFLLLLINIIVDAYKKKPPEPEYSNLDKQIMDDLNIDIPINHSTNLNTNQEYVLDLYEKCNIKIPVEIIDDLSYNQLTDVKEIFDYIETQRQAWKYEHMKKPSFRRSSL